MPEGAEVTDVGIDAVVEEAEIVGKTEGVEEDSVEETDVIEAAVVESAVVVKTEVAVEAIVVEGMETVMGLDVAPPPLPPWRIPFLIAWSKRSFAMVKILAESDEGWIEMRKRCIPNACEASQSIIPPNEV